MTPTNWLLLVMSIPGHQGSDRVRIWRALKSLGTAVLRDGVYLAPASADMRAALKAQQDAVREIGGKAYLFHHADPEGSELFPTLFDRGDDYLALIEQVSEFRDTLSGIPESEARRRQAQFRRDLEGIHSVDFFPGHGFTDAVSAMDALDGAINQQFSPDEPESRPGALPRRNRKDFRGRQWATRKNIWVDRIASAWLIQRFIDPDGKFVWLDKPSDCPKGAVGFDFDGAEFSHVGERVTFEVLLHCFGLTDDTALSRIGSMVHFLDVGGIPVPEATGFVTLLSGARRLNEDDGELLIQAAAMLDFLYDAYSATT